MALYLSGTSYTTENHFATVDPADITMVPCGAPQEDGGLWVLDR